MAGALRKIEDRHHDIKKELAGRVRHQLRTIPVLKFSQDNGANAHPRNDINSIGRFLSLKITPGKKEVQDFGL